MCPKNKTDIKIEQCVLKMEQWVLRIKRIQKFNTEYKYKSMSIKIEQWVLKTEQLLLEKPRKQTLTRQWSITLSFSSPKTKIRDSFEMFLLLKYIFNYGMVYISATQNLYQYSFFFFYTAKEINCALSLGSDIAS